MPLKTELVTVNMGPHHPSTHGVFRMRVTLDGEVVREMEPMFGYLHRGIEKLAEGRTYTQNIPFTDRLDYVSSMAGNFSYCLSVEKLMGIEVPERAEYLRVIMCELQRMVNHLIAVGFFLNDLGAMMTPLLLMWREREKIVDLFEMACGQRLLYNYIRIGGVSQDVPSEFVPALEKFLDDFPGYFQEFEDLLKGNEILQARTIGTGVISARQAINASMSGPCLRASGVDWDLRRDDSYSIYDRLNFDVIVGKNGDNYDRYRVRMAEIMQSHRIVRQALAKMTDLSPVSSVRARIPKVLRPPKGEVYAAIEAPKGEMGFYLVSDGSAKPYRWHVRAPDFINLGVLRDMVVGSKIADLIVTFGSIDICLASVDR
ncbi:MAG: NADH-quinone oxidoreductase subunit D [Dehalococcoidia bacterium]|nr:NADH-quinone oxidoreductase subunit D [Dehalococcoidia bacterium]